MRWRQSQVRSAHPPGVPLRLGRRGYSFIEMLSIIVLLAILLAIAILSLAPSIKQAKVRNAANVVAGDIQYAQALSVQHRTPIAIVVVPATRQYIIRERNNPSNVFRTRSLGPNSEYALETFTATPTSVEVFPNGVARQSTTFSLILDSYQRDVLLSRAGQIRIVKP